MPAGDSTRCCKERPAGRCWRTPDPGPRPGQCRLAAWRVRLCRGAFSGLEIEACLSGDGVSLRMTVPRPVPLSLGLALARHAVQVEMDVTDAAPE